MQFQVLVDIVGQGLDQAKDKIGDVENAEAEQESTKANAPSGPPPASEGEATRPVQSCAFFGFLTFEELAGRGQATYLAQELIQHVDKEKITLTNYEVLNVLQLFWGSDSTPTETTTSGLYCNLCATRRVADIGAFDR